MVIYVGLSRLADGHHAHRLGSADDCAHTSGGPTLGAQIDLRYRADTPTRASDDATFADEPGAASGEIVGATSARVHAFAKRMCTAAASSVLP